MGYEYQCPECGKLHGEHYSYACLPGDLLCDTCADKEFEKETRNKERETVLDEVVNRIDKLYQWYDCEPQPSVEFEEGACSALEHLRAQITLLRKEGKEVSG